ncbi:Ig-like domain-containing protein [Marinicella sp. W31]|uniref:Ig-like domain-containing protein n=1 Tax=Marinicella sp. W31 TaxID=3023713 RepID=UPI003756C7D3
MRKTRTSAGWSLFILFFLLFFMASTAQSAGSNITICSVDGSAGARGGTRALNGTDGANMRAKLLNSAHFGPTGTVNITFTIVDTFTASGSITASSLASNGCEILVVPNINEAFIPASEANIIRDWVVIDGGSLVTFSDNLIEDRVETVFGQAQLTNNTVASFTPVASSPIFSGPFGVVSSVPVTPPTAYTNASFVGTTVLATGNAAERAIVEIGTNGNGYGVQVGDMDTVSTLVSVGNGNNTVSDAFALNLFTQLANEFNINNVPPAEPVITSPVAGFINDNTPTVTGTADASVAIDVSVPSGQGCTTTSNAAGNWSCTISPNLAEGGVVISAEATRGLLTSTADTVAVTVDTIAPSAPIIATPTNGAPVSGTGEPGAVVSVSSATLAQCSVTVQPDGSWSCTLVPPAGNGETISAFQTDAAGNTSPTTSVTNGIDTVPPAAANCSVSPNPAQTGAVLTATCTGVETGATVSIPDYSCGSESGGQVSCTGLAGAGSVTGDRTATTTDTAGNSNTSNVPFTLDDTAPTAASCTVSPNPANNGTGLTATCTGVESGATVSILDYSCGAEIGGTVSCIATAGTGAGQVNGDRTATTTDAAGNSNTSTAAFTLDNTAPTAASCTVSPNPANNGTGLTATCTGVESGATVSIPDYSCGAESGGTVSCMATAGAGAGQVNGDRTATTTDAAGNSNSSNVAFTLDNTAPTAASCSVSPNPANNGTTLTATCTGVESGAMVSIPDYSCNAESGGAVSCTATAGAGAGQVNGDRTATTTDAAGNSNSSNVAFTLDNTAPTAASCSVSPNPANNGTTLTATCTGVESGAMVSIPDYSCNAESGGAVSCTATAGAGAGQVNGDRTATTTDAAGNSNTSNVAFTLDNSGPTAASCTVSPNPANNGTTLTATCTGVESGATVSIPDYSCNAESGGTVSCTATAGAGAGQVDGDRTATTTDTANNTATSNVPFILDNDAPPAPTIDAPTNGMPITGTGEPGAMVDVTTPSGSSCTATVQADGTWSCTLSPTPTDGEDITADQTDPAGNTSPPVTVTGGVDLTAPTPPVIDPVDVNTDPISGTAEPGSTITITGVVCDNAPVLADANGNWSCDVTTSSPLTSGSVITATATDVAGNESGPATTTVNDITGGQSVSPTLNPVANGATEITGTAVSGSVINVASITCSNSPVTADISGDWRCDAPNPTPVTNNVVSVTATQTGLTASAPVTTTVYDPSVTGPAAPQVDPTDGSVVTGSAIANGVVSVLDDNGMLLCTTTANASGNFSCSPLSPAPGNGDLLTVLVTDANGNDSAPTHVIVDQSPPGAPVITAPANGTLTNNNTPTVTGTAEVGSTVVVTGPNGETCSDVVDASGNWSCPISPALGEGSNQLDAVATDVNNNSSAPGSVTITVDTVRPSTPQPDLPSRGTPLTGIGEPGATVNIGTGSGASCSALVQPDGTWSCSLAPSNVLVNGEPVVASQTDAAGNQSDTVVFTIGIDLVPPTPPVIDPVDVNTNPVTGLSEADATINITGVVCDNAPVVADANGNWSCDVTTSSPLTAGSVITATATDVAGNESGPATATVNDVASGQSVSPTLNPVANGATEITGSAVAGSVIDVAGISCSNSPVTAATDGQWRCDAPAPTPVTDDVVSVTATQSGLTASAPVTTTVYDASVTGIPAPQVDPTDGTVVTGSTEPNYGVAVFDAVGTVLCTTTADATGNFSCSPLSPLPADGDVLRVLAGNNGQVSPPTFVTVDQTAPNVPVITAPTDGALTNDNTPTVTGTAEAGTTVVVTGPNGESCSVVADSGGNWSCDVSPALADGSNQLSATATDSIGNTSGPANVTITVDTVPPPPPSPDLPTRGTPVTGTGEPGATVNIDTDSGASCSALVQPDGTWSCSLAPSNVLVNGESVGASQTDAAGNESNTIGFTVGIDLVPPTPPVIDPVDVNTNPITGLSEADAIINITGVVCDNAPVMADANGEWSCDVTLSSPLVAGSVITATATDVAGNESGPASATVNDVANGQSVSPTLNPVVNGATEITGSAVAGSVIDVAGISCSNSPVTAASDGQWRCDTPAPTPVTDDVVSVTATQSGLTASAPVTTTVYDAIVTGIPAPQVDPTDGTVVTGSTEPNYAIAVFNATGTLLCTVSADVSGNFSCSPLSPAPADGDVLRVLAGNNGQVSPPTFVTVDQTAPNMPVITAPLDGALINDNTPTVSGTAEAGVTVVVMGPNGESCSAMADSAGNWSCDVTPALNDGSNQLDATASDPVGNTSGADNVTITVDSTIPPPPVINAPTNGAPVSGSGEVGATVNVTTPSGASCSAVVQANGSWSCSLSPTPLDGEDITADQTDSVGNTSLPTTVSGGIDLTPPADPVITSPANGALLSTNVVAVIGTGDPGSIITVSGPNGEMCSVVVDAAGNWSCVKSPNLQDGVNQLDVVANDDAGNNSNTVSVTITIDTTAPDAPVINAPTNGDPVSGTGEVGAVVTVTTPSGASCTATVQADGSWLCILVPEPIDGEDITATQTDAAGNTSPPTTVTGGIDTIAPNAPVITSPVNGAVTNDNTPTVTGTAEAGATVTVTALNGETCMVVADTAGMWNCEIAPALADGVQALTALATDPAGNDSPTNSVTITVDTMAPNAPVITTPTNGSPVSGTGEIGATVVVTTPSGSTCTATVQVDGTWSCSLSPEPIDGEDITAVQTDEAGNDSDPTTVTGGIDTVAPDAPVITAPVSGSTIMDATPTVTGTAEVDATVVVTGPNGETCSAVADASGNWSCELAPALPDGAVQLSAVATDAAGNDSQPATVDFTVASDTAYDVVVTPGTELVTTEMGGTATFDIALSLTPSADVTVSLSSSDTTEGTIDTNSITFTPANWNVPVTVTVTGVDDQEFDMDQNYQILTAAFVSADPNYNGVDPSDVDAINIDDDANPDLSIFLTNCTADVAPGVPVIYRVIVDNVGNVDITGAQVQTSLTDLMTTPDWVCESQTGGCTATSGTGDLSEMVDLMAGDQVTYTMRGEVTAQLMEFLDSTATVTMPVSETDTDPSNNMAEDSDLTIQYLFKDNFDCDLPGTIESTTQQLEELLRQYE